MSKVQQGLYRGSGAAVTLVAAVSAFGGSNAASVTTVSVTAGKPSEFHFDPLEEDDREGPDHVQGDEQGHDRTQFQDRGKKTVLIKPGKTVTLKVTFAKAGKFPFRCTVPSHAAAGMKGTLTVK